MEKKLFGIRDNVDDNDKRTDEEFISDCNYAVLVIEKETRNVLHMVFYEHNPSDETMNELKHELAVDETHGLIDYPTENLSFCVICKQMPGIYDYR